MARRCDDAVDDDSERGWRPARREARVVAAVVDLIVVALIGVLFGLLALAVMLAQADPREIDPTLGEWIWGYAAASLWLPASALYIGLAGARGGTLGARLLTLRVQAPPAAALSAAVFRAILWWPGGIALIALWWPWIDPAGRSLVDRLTGTWLLERAAS